jgi:hypothetical protein
MLRASTRTALVLLAAGTIVVVSTGCDEKKGQLIPNIPPEVRLTAFPPDSGTSGYDVEFFWEGWDSDGEIDYFLRAIDPPDMYDMQDSVWTRTDDNSGSFIFEAADYDTLYHWREPQIASSWHVFVIKAVDDMGASSDPAYLAFNSSTIAPRSQIRTPPPVGGIQEYRGSSQRVGLKVTFRWDGDDVDGLLSTGPVGYLFKVTDVGGESAWNRLASIVWEDTSEWIEYGPNERRVTLDLDDGHNYAVTVRAVDEAGAAEPLLLLNGNMLWVGARKSSSFPDLTLNSQVLGERTWHGWSQDTETYEVPVGSRYELEALGNAGWYGGMITGYSHAWDISDLESEETDPDGDGAWTPWSARRDVITAEFSEIGDHFLHVRCKDDGGGRALASVKFHVLPLDPPKNLCYIDDWRRHPKSGLGGEELDDETWQNMLEGYNYGEDWQDVSWDEWDVPSREHMPSLEFLSQFRVVVWSLNANRSVALNEKPAWFHMNYLNTTNVLAVYMRGRNRSGEKGKVWAFGRGLVEASLLPDLGMFCEYPYPVDDDRSVDPDCGIRSGSFAFDQMHIRGEFDRSDKGSGGTRISLFGDGYQEYGDRPVAVFVDTAGPAIPENLYTRPPAAELYPSLPRRMPRYPGWWGRAGSNFFFEVLEYPEPGQEEQHIFCDPASGRMTDLIPLFRVQTNYTDSKAYNKYCGFRYLPSNPEDGGDFVYFFFPMFIFKDAEIRATAKVVLSDWFGLPDPDVQVAASAE